MNKLSQVCVVLLCSWFNTVGSEVRSSCTILVVGLSTIPQFVSEEEKEMYVCKQDFISFVFVVYCE